MQETLETRVQSLGGEDILEEEMAKPLQYSCQDNPMDRGVCQVPVHWGLKRVRYDLAAEHIQVIGGLDF